MEMNAQSVQMSGAQGYTPVKDMRNGFQEQTEILSQLSKQLDEYFSLRSVGIFEQ